jgi:hypothetical protein
MPFCPSCRSEYRPEFTTCKNCGGIALVEKLPEVVGLSDDELESALPVGFTEGGSGRGVEVDGRMIDPSRVFLLDRATLVREALADFGVAAAVVPLEDVFFPDNAPRFEVRVRPEDQSRAEKFLVGMWRDQLAEEGIEAGEGEVDIETCPACGFKVPLDVEECPDCGLVVGTGAEREAAAQAEEA